MDKEKREPRVMPGRVVPDKKVRANDAGFEMTPAVFAKLDGIKDPDMPAANKLTKQRIDKLFRMFCVHALSPREVVAAQWEECQTCILHDVKWRSKEGLITNLCYAYWFEDVLNV
jgi:hypothetical protein